MTRRDRQLPPLVNGQLLKIHQLMTRRDRQLPPLVNGQLLKIHQLMTRRDRQLPPARRRASGASPTHARRRGCLPPPVRLAPRALPPPRAAAGQLPVNLVCGAPTDDLESTAFGAMMSVPHRTFFVVERILRNLSAVTDTEIALLYSDQM